MVGKLLIPSNVTLKTDLSLYPSGDHRATLQAKNALNDNLIRNKHPNTGNTLITIQDIKFEGNSANQTALSNPCSAIGFYYVDSSEVTNCAFNDFELDGVYLGRSGSVDSIAVGGACSNITIDGDCEFTNIRRNGVSITRWQNVRILNSTFTDCNKGVPDNALYLAGAIDFEPNDVLDECDGGEVGYCTFNSQYAPSIQIAGDGIKTNLNFHHNTITQNGGGGAVEAFTPVDGLDIDDNIINATDARGIWVNGQTEDMLNVNARRNTLAGNDAAAVAGIGFNYVTNGLIDENHVTDYATGILVFTCDAVAITDNELTSCADPIDIGSSTNITQSGNVEN